MKRKQKITLETESTLHFDNNYLSPPLIWPKHFLHSATYNYMEVRSRGHNVWVRVADDLDCLSFGSG
jgi:hypothetical protein